MIPSVPPQGPEEVLVLIALDEDCVVVPFPKGATASLVLSLSEPEPVPVTPNHGKEVGVVVGMVPSPKSVETTTFTYLVE